MNKAEISQDDSEDWVRSVDCGGLKYEMMCMMFCIHGTRHLRISKASQGPQRETLKQKIRESEDVLFYWCPVPAEWEQDMACTLLDMIVNHHSLLLWCKWMARKV